MTATQVTFRRAVVPPLALLLGVSSATQAVPRPAQQPGATPSLPPVRAELVQLDVVVTDRDGRCVRQGIPRASRRCVIEKRSASER